MKTITTTLNKLFIAMLSFVTMFVCAFTFPMHKASASTTVDGDPIPDEVLIGFMERIMEDFQLVEGGDPLCFLFDNRFFNNAVSETTMLSDIADTPVIQTMAQIFATLLEEDVINPLNDYIDVQPIFSQINMNIIIQVDDATYVNVMTGDSHTNLESYYYLSNWNGYVTPTTIIYGMINLPRDANHYQLLRTTQREHSGPVNIFVLVEDGVSPNTGALNAPVYTWSECV